MGGRCLRRFIRISNDSILTESLLYLVISEEVSLIFCERTNLRCALFASRSGSVGCEGCECSSGFTLVATPLELPVAGTTPALTRALKRLAMLGTAGVLEVDGAGTGWDDSRRDRSIDSSFGCSYETGYVGGCGAADMGGGGGKDCGAA